MGHVATDDNLWYELKTNFFPLAHFMVHSSGLDK